MRVTMLLADAVQAVGGKLYVLGGGWSMTGPEPAASGIAIKIEVPWDEANKPHNLQLVLIDGDGRPFLIPTPAGPRPLEITADFETGRPAGLRPGSPLGVVLAIDVAPLPLEPDNAYVWRCSVDGRTHEDWQVGFSTRPASRGGDTGARRSTRFSR